MPVTSHIACVCVCVYVCVENTNIYFPVGAPGRLSRFKGLPSIDHDASWRSTQQGVGFSPLSVPPPKLFSLSL